MLVALGSLLLAGCERLSFAPDPTRAWVAISVGDDPIARTGPVEIAAGTPFTLHAVLEAGEGSRRVFYTEAAALVVAGEQVDPEAIRVWEGSERASILWFTVEGSAPFVATDDATAVASFAFRENFRADWARTWSIPGSVQPLRETAMALPTRLRPTHGTMRYHVRIELYGSQSEIRPKFRFSSMDADLLPEKDDEFPAVTVVEPGALRTPTAVFGLTQFEGANEVFAGVDLPSWVHRRIGFSRAAALKVTLQGEGLEWADLDWRDVDLAEESNASLFEPGTLLRAGDRVVYLYRDEGPAGLDYQDLCLDFEDGARVLPLADVFGGSGLVELAPLTR